MPATDELPFYINTCQFGGYAYGKPRRSFTKKGTEWAYLPMIQYHSGPRQKDGLRPHQIILVQTFMRNIIERMMQIGDGEAFIALGRIVVPYGHGLRLTGQDAVKLVSHFICRVRPQDVEQRKWEYRSKDYVGRNDG